MSTSANVIEYNILKDDKVVGHFRKNIMCRLPLYSELLKYEPLIDHEILTYGYDEEEEYWEKEVENLDAFLRRMTSSNKEISNFYNK